jgi:hypothetical protein
MIYTNQCSYRNLKTLLIRFYKTFSHQLLLLYDVKFLVLCFYQDVLEPFLVIR